MHVTWNIFLQNIVSENVLFYVSHQTFTKTDLSRVITKYAKIKTRPDKALNLKGMCKWICFYIHHPIQQIIRKWLCSNRLDWGKCNTNFQKRWKVQNIKLQASLTYMYCLQNLEHIVVSNVLDHLDLYNILVDNQHGFCARRSCKTQLVGFIHDLAKSIQGSQVDVAIMDFSTFLTLFTMRDCYSN